MQLQETGQGERLSIEPTDAAGPSTTVTAESSVAHLVLNSLGLLCRLSLACLFQQHLMQAGFQMGL
jgi:hypothetical protein